MNRLLFGLCVLLMGFHGNAQSATLGDLCAHPVAHFAGKANGDALCTGMARAAIGLVVKCGSADEQNDSVRFEVLSFRLVVTEMSYTVADKVFRRVTRKARGARLTEQMKVAIDNAAPGDSILVENIFIRGADGHRLKLEDLRFELSGDCR